MIHYCITITAQKAMLLNHFWTNIYTHGYTMAFSHILCVHHLYTILPYTTLLALTNWKEWQYLPCCSCMLTWLCHNDVATLSSLHDQSHILIMLSQSSCYYTIGHSLSQTICYYNSNNCCSHYSALFTLLHSFFMGFSASDN